MSPARALGAGLEYRSRRTLFGTQNSLRNMAISAPIVTDAPTRSDASPFRPEENKEPSSRERSELAGRLRRAQRAIVDAWYRSQFDIERLSRYNVPGAAELSRDIAVRSYVEPLFALLLAYVKTGRSRYRDIYVDERLRYAPHLSAPEIRLRYFQEVLSRDEDTLWQTLSLEDDLRRCLAFVLQSAHASLLEKPTRTNVVRVLAVGDCLMGDVRTFLSLRARSAGIGLDMRTLYFSASVEQTLKPESIVRYLSEHPTDVIAFSFLTYRGLPLYTALLRAADRGNRVECEGRVAALLTAMHHCLREIREHTDAPFLIHNASGLPLTRVREKVPLLPAISRRRRGVLDDLNLKIAELVANTPNAILIDEADIARQHGERACAASALPSRVARDAFFHTSEMGDHLAAAYEDVLRSFAALRRAKVLLVDFDNTLWQGVMADGPVVHYGERQRLLKNLKDGGMLLVALSKNDASSIRWNEMTLAPTDFVLHKVSWDLKVQSAEQAARELDLGMDTFVFIDDNPVELDLMRSHLSKVHVLDAGDAFTWRSLERLLSFPNTRDTEEARARTELYREQALRREELAKGFDYASMMHGLGLQASLGRAAHADLPRLVELQQRTNQFNTTTLRYSREQLAGLMKSESHRVYAASLRDKFGDVGLVCTAIVRDAANEKVIDSFVMSCRAMGFELERLVLSKLIEAEGTAMPIVGRFVPTDRNAPAMQLFSSNGFVARSDSEWVLEKGSAAPPAPTWFIVQDRA